MSKVSFGKWLLGLALAFTSVACFASTFVLGGELTRNCGVSPIAIVTIRFFFASVLMMAIASRNAVCRRRLFSICGRDWVSLAVFGALGTAAMAWFMFAACARVSSANAAMSDSLSPLMIFVFGAIMARRVTLCQAVGVIFGFVGALLVIGIVNAGGFALSAYGLGDVFVLLSALSWAVYTIVGRHMVPRIGSGPFTIWTMLFGALACLPVVALSDVSWPSTSTAWGYTVYICLVPTFIAYWAWNASLHYLSASTAAMTAYFTPVFALVLAYFMFGERVTGLQLVGTLFVCAAAIVEIGGSRKEGLE